MNSDISNRIRLSGLSNISAARRLTSSVFPTPEPPTKIKLTGFRFTFRPTRPRRIAAQRVSIASSCPTTCSFSLASNPASRSSSSSLIDEAGILVHSSMMRARLSTVSSGFGLASSSFSSASLCISRLLSSATRAYRWSSISSVNSIPFGASALISASRSKRRFSRSRCSAMRRLISGCFRLTSEQASSKRSIALSGRKRSVM